MVLPSLSSIASSPATTCAPETPRVKPLPGPIPMATASASSSAAAMGPPPAPKTKATTKPTKEQVKTEIDLIMREADAHQTRQKQSDERQMHNAVPAAIFKAVREDTVPESYVYPCARRTPRSRRIGIWNVQWACLLVLEPPATVWLSSMPVNWIYSCSGTGLVGYSPNALEGWTIRTLEGSRTSSCQIQSAHGTSLSMMTTWPTSRLLIVMPSLPPRLLHQVLKWWQPCSVSEPHAPGPPR